MKTRILLILVLICQISYGQVTKSTTTTTSTTKLDRPIPLNKASKHVRLLSYSNPNEEPESVVNTHNPNSFYHHKKSNSQGFTVIEDAEFEKLYSKPSNQLKTHETARSRNQTAQEEENAEIEIGTLKSPRHGRNSIYHHKRSASKRCITIEDAQFEKLYENTPTPTKIKKHKKKPSKEGVRTTRVKF